ncbi:MAG TPA: methylmalonyl-CoA epimerase, partial [Chroococcales cyanobacterium]
MTSRSVNKGTRLDHIAVAVTDLNEALEFYKNKFGLQCLGIEEVPEQGVRVAKLELGNTHLELLEPLSEDTPVGKYLKQRGPGLHHICIGVDDICTKLDALKTSGTRLIDEKPK